MAVIIDEVANGLIRFQFLWLQGEGFKFHLKLWDKDGDVDERIVEWTATEDMSWPEAMAEVVATLDPLPHWRARYSDFELSIAPSNPRLAYRVEVERI